MSSTTVPDAADLVTAYVEMLARVTRLQVGDAAAPGDQQATPDYPYLLVDVIPGGGSRGDLDNPDSVLDVVVQVTAVGRRRDQAHKAAVRAHQATLARTDTGWANPLGLRAGSELDREHQASGGVDREGDLFNAVERYVLTVAV